MLFAPLSKNVVRLQPEQMGDHNMRYFKMYDDYLKRLAQGGDQSTGIGPMGIGSIFIAAAPVYVATLCVSAAFETLRLAGIVGFLSKASVYLGLIVSMGYSVFKVICYMEKK